MQTQRNKLDFKGRKIYAVFDVHLKSRKVTIMTDKVVHNTTTIENKVLAMRKIKLKINFIVVHIFLIIPYNIAIAQSKLSFYPDLAGWEKIEKIEIYNKSNLYDYIDGGATQYLENNFKKLYVLNYLNRENESIIVEIYKHTSNKDVSFLYQNELSTGIDSMKIGLKGYMIGTTILYFIQDNYYVKIYSNQHPKAIKSYLLQIGKSIEQNLKK